MLERFLFFLQPYGHASYWVIFGVLVLCGFGLPMPEDIILVTGGILASQHIIDPFWTFVVSMAGVLIGDGVIFAVGRRYGQRARKLPLINKVLNEERDLKVQKLFHRFGDFIIFVGRFLPGLRMPIFLTAGSYQISAWKFFLLDGFAALISVPVWIYVGFLFGSNLDVLEKYVRRMQLGIFGLAFIAIVLIVSIVLIKRSMKKRDLA